MKRMLLFLMLIPLAFAGWQSMAAVAMAVSAMLLAVIFMVGMGFGISNLQILAKEEFFQLLALGVLVIALVSTDSILNAISTSPAFKEPGAVTMQETAMKMLNASRDQMNEIFEAIRFTDRMANIEGSQASQCNIMGMGYSVSGCGAFSMLATPLSMAGGIAGFAIGELSAIHRLIFISDTYALQLLLPLGIVLRTVRLTRGAGGLLIALGISLHIMLPAGIIFSEMLGERFLHPVDPADAVYNVDYQPAAATYVEFDCNPGDATPATGGYTNNELNAIEGYNELRSDLRSYLYVALIKATLGPVLALLMMAASIRALTSIAGAEVDVSAISRFV